VGRGEGQRLPSSQRRNGRAALAAHSHLGTRGSFYILLMCIDGNKAIRWEGDIMTMNLKLPHRRQFLHLAAGAAALPVMPRIARAQVYPSRSVRIIVPFGPAGAPDLVARLMGQCLSERFGQQFVIDNRPGAGGNVGTEAVVRARPDAYTLLMAGTYNAISATLYDHLNFVFLRDIAPVASMARTAHVVVVHLSVPAKTVPEFIAYAKANPGKINMASAGTGSATHLVGELFKMMAGVDLVHVPYRDLPYSDLIAGRVQVYFASVPSSIAYIKAGTLRALAVTTSTRSELLPDIPVVGDFVPKYEASFWTGLGAPKNTPAEIVERLNKEINAALADPKIQGRFADLGGAVLPGSPADFGKLIADETEKWGKVIRAANIKPE
jgi:tripartite-type tricarboxylate transporter receptor subunit TctC